MKTASFLLAALAALPVLAHARSFQTFGSSFNSYNLENDFTNNGGVISDIPAATDFSAPVGYGTFRHSGAPLADGSYAFSSFSDLTIFIDFEIGENTYSFGESHIISDTSGLQVYVADGAFHLLGDHVTTYIPSIDRSVDGTVFFQNGDYLLMMDTNALGYHAYSLIHIPAGEPPSSWSGISMGLYGTPETAYFGSAVPEPSSFAALAGLGALALTVARRRRAA